MFLPSSMMGDRQYAQLTLQGSLCLVVFSELSYQPRSWWPCVKLMSSLWKMAAHWKGAPNSEVQTLASQGQNHGQKKSYRGIGEAYHVMSGKSCNGSILQPMESHDSIDI